MHCSHVRIIHPGHHLCFASQHIIWKTDCSNSYVNPTTASLWMVNFFGAVLNKGNLFLGKVGPMRVALGSEPASPQRTVGISLDLFFQPSLLQVKCLIFIFPYIWTQKVIAVWPGQVKKFELNPGRFGSSGSSHWRKMTSRTSLHKQTELLLQDELSQYHGYMPF